MVTELISINSITIFLKQNTASIWRSLQIWVEVDGSFDPSAYTIRWYGVQSLSTVICRGTGNTWDFTLNVENVSYCPEIHIDLISKKEWHRFHNRDDYIVMKLEDVLPPIEDTY